MFSPDSFEKGHFTAPEITRGEVYLSHTIRKHIKLKAKKIPWYARGLRWTVFGFYG